MTDAHEANPAGRLWALLNETMGYSRQGSTVAVRQIWCDYLGISVGDDVEYFAAIAEVISMPNQIADAVARIAHPVPPADVLLEPLDPIRAALGFAASPGASVSQMMSNVHEGHLSTLRTCSFVLTSQGPQPTLGEQRRVELIEHARSIVDLLLSDTDLPVDLRRQILTAAQRIIASLSLYKVAGAEAALDEWDRVVGALIRDPEAIRQHAKHPAVQRLNKLGAALLVAMNIYTGIPAIGAATHTYAELLGNATVVDATSPNDAPVVDDNDVEDDSGAADDSVMHAEP
ncbi:hypothetical protein [Agromyces sp. NPDC056965]|uniref:hypothetical protein n=1 Tax=Agromyces sp. NPDC056965 TaxID=3345983 RepID=UPI00362C5430